MMMLQPVGQTAETVDHAKQPPHNLSLEQAVLGAILIDNGAIERAVGLEPGHFFDPLHGNIFETMAGLIAAGKLASPLTVKTFFENAAPIDAHTSVPQYIGTLAAQAPTITGVRDYTAALIDMARRRALIIIGEDMAAECYDATADGASAAIIEEAEKRLFDLVEKGVTGGAGAVTFADAMRRAYEQARFAHGLKGKIAGLSTGLIDLDDKLGGMAPSDLIILAGRPSMGKAQPLDASVLTAQGWSVMGELKVGDALASIDGQPSFVTGVFPQGKKQVYHVEFCDGRAAECCDEHLWKVHFKGWSEPKIISTAQVRELLTKRHMQNRLYVETFSGEFGVPYAGLDPWLIGVLIGDGCVRRSKVMLSSSDAGIIERVQQVVGSDIAVTRTSNYDYILTKSHRSCCAFCGAPFSQNSRKRKFCDNTCSCASHYYTRRRGNDQYKSETKRPGPEKNWLIDALRSIGLWSVRAEDKRIPDNLLLASRSDRLALLRGLLDTDGTVETWGTIRFCTVSRELARQVIDLVRSLGGIARGYPKPAKDERHKTAWIINITGIQAEASELFTLERKASRLKTFTRKQRLTIKSITPTRVTDVQCISVSHPSHLYVTNDYVVTHNTALAVNIAWHVANYGRVDAHGVASPAPVGFFSLEMKDTQLATRVAAACAGISSEKIRRGMMTDEELEHLARTSNEISHAPLYIDERGGITIAQLSTRARHMRRRYGIELLIVDYLQLLAGKKGGDANRVQEITEITTGLKSLAKELNIPILALSQLSRQVESRTDKRPQLSDLRESGSIEQDADVVMFVYREEYYLERTKPDDASDPTAFADWQRRFLASQGLAEAIIGKQRHGPTGTVKLAFDGSVTRFSNLAIGDRHG